MESSTSPTDVWPRNDVDQTEGMSHGDFKRSLHQQLLGAGVLGSVKAGGASSHEKQFACSIVTYQQLGAVLRPVWTHAVHADQGIGAWA